MKLSKLKLHLFKKSTSKSTQNLLTTIKELFFKITYDSYKL